MDGLVSSLLSTYTFYIVPNMCPDGSVLGHIRTNAAGANLNREWCDSPGKGDVENGGYKAPTMERSPEVYLVLHKMIETGVDFFCDVHGDEEYPYNFIAGSEGVPKWGPRLEALQGAFIQAYSRANCDMQVPFSYEPDPIRNGPLNICSNQIAERFDCLSVTLEMPYKDCSTNPDPERGFSTGRCEKLGESLLDAIFYMKDMVRDEGEFWKGMKEEDKYVRQVEPKDCIPPDHLQKS